MKTLVFSVSLLFVFCFAPLCRAAQTMAADLPDLIQKKYNDMKTFEADFVQELTNVSSGSVDVRKGKICFSQPSLVRWQTTEPENEILVLGQDIAWDYFADENLVFKYRVGALLDSKTILRFLSGRANIKEDFYIKTEWEGADSVRKKWGKGYEILQLTPKEPEPGMVQAYIGVEPGSGLLRQVMIIDFYGNGNEIRLSNVRQGVKLDAALFNFTPPKGVQVEDNTGAY